MPVETELWPQRRAIRTFVVMGPGSRSRSLSSGAHSRDPLARLSGTTEIRCSPPPTAVIPRASGVSSTPRLVGSITDASGILDRPVPSTPRLRRGIRSPWPAEALAKAASRAMTTGVWRALTPSLRAKRRNSWSLARKNGLLRRFAPRNDVAPVSNMTPRSRGAGRPRFAKTVRASINRGRRESRVANAPAASRAK
jgi:hypothetical protein